MTTKKNEQKIDFIWCSPHPNHYNSYMFEHLAQIEEIDFRAVYFKEKLVKYPWKTNFSGRLSVYYLSVFFGLDWKFIVNRIFNKRELLSIAGWNNPTMLIILIYFSITNRKFVLFSDTPETKTERSVKGYFRRKILNYVFKKTFKFLVTGSSGVKNSIALGVKRDKLINFPFATNINYYVPSQEEGLTSKQIKFISSGRLDNAHKAYDLAIEAFCLLKTRHPEYSFQYRIAGTGPDQEQLQALIRERKMNNEVSLLGWFEPADLVSFYQSGDVFLHPSHVDPFPNAVLEAMACGLPIVGSDAAGSVVDRVIEGENGYIHQDHNIESLYGKLLLICEQTPEQRILMGGKSRETAEKWHVSYNTGVIQSIVQDYLIKA